MATKSILTDQSLQNDKGCPIRIKHVLMKESYLLGHLMDDINSLLSYRKYMTPNHPDYAVVNDEIEWYLSYLNSMKDRLINRHQHDHNLDIEVATTFNSGGDRLRKFIIQGTQTTQ